MYGSNSGSFRALECWKCGARVPIAVFCVIMVLLAGWLPVAQAADLIMNGGTVTLGGVQHFGVVSLTNGAKVIAVPYNGSDKTNTGNLEIYANSITIDATSQITAKGAGYAGLLCRNGPGPTNTAGGRGGCAVLDSGGGGGHFGNGGPGTKACSMPGCTFPSDYEEAGSDAVSGLACLTTVNIRNNDGLPSVIGLAYSHPITTIEFGAAGGDKGCRDGDGFSDRATGLGGAGGGRIALYAPSGTLTIDGRVDASGNRGCASNNDAAGGGAGGTVLLNGDQVVMGASAVVTAAGGKGGDSLPKCLTCSTNSDCGGTGQTCNNGLCSPCNCTPCASDAQCNAALGQTCKNLGGALGNVCANASNQCSPVDAMYNESECVGTQHTGTSDKGGGGGGGGIVELISRASVINSLASFRASGGAGGGCATCGDLAGQTDGVAGVLALTTVSLSSPDNQGSEVGPDGVTFRFTRSPVAATALTVSYTVAGSATNGVDYSPLLGGTITIPANQTSVDLVLTPIPDNNVEGDETVVLTLVETADYHALTTSASATLTDKAAPGLGLSLGAATIDLGNNVVLTATLSGGSSPTLPTGTVDFRDNGASITGCSAQALSGGIATCSTTGLAAGTHSNLQARYGGDGLNSAALSPTRSLVVRGSQSISFPALANTSFSAGPVILSATASSGLAVSFTSASPSRCTVSGTALSFVTLGTCQINADQAGDASWQAAATVSRSFAITPPASSALETRSGPAATGAGTITVSGQAPGSPLAWSRFRFISLVGDSGSPPANSAPQNLVFPFGLFDFAVSGITPGGSLVLNVQYPGAIPAGAVYWKYGPTPDNSTAHWYELPVVVSADRLTVSFTLVDGGLGDDDLLPNGVVVDQGGPAVPASPAEIATLSPGLLALLSLLLLGSGLAVARTRRGR